MRYLLVAACLAASGVSWAQAETGQLIGQLGHNGDDTGQRSSASLSQIGKRAVDSGGLVDQIDPATVAVESDDIDETAVSSILPGQQLAGDCKLSSSQEAVLDYLRQEGRVFDDNCAMLVWLSDKSNQKPSDRDLFNVIFGPDSQRAQQAELERLRQEKEQAEARAQLMEAMAAGAGGG